MTRESSPEPTDEEITEALRDVYEKLLKGNVEPFYVDSNDLWELYQQEENQ